jgi:hypothetical protein
MTGREYLAGVLHEAAEALARCAMRAGSTPERDELHRIAQDCLLAASVLAASIAVDRDVSHDPGGNL